MYCSQTGWVLLRRWLALLALLAFGPPAHAEPGAPRYTAVATVGMVGDLVRSVAGDRAEVVVLMASGVDPHLYRPTRSDLQRLMRAEVIFSNGLLLEGKLVEALTRAADAGKTVVAVAERLDPADLLDPEGLGGHSDPHVWMDPTLWAKAAGVIRDALTEFDPAGAEVYRVNAERAIDAIRGLDEYASGVLASVAEGERVLITAHDAFGYFGRRFGYEVVGIQGLSTESEAGVRDIERLVNLIVSRGIKAVFIESTVSERNINALIAGARAKGHTVAIGGSLFSDAMGADGTYEGTYLGMIDHNATTIARALGGQTPPRGMRGKLAEP